MMTTRFTRRTLLQTAALATAATALRAYAWESAAASPVTVTTPLGPVIGNAQPGGVNAFLGLPFAQPPVDALRFRAPQPVKPWQSPRNAQQFAPSAIQPGRKDTSEDCLYLNVYGPAEKAHSSKGYPVFFWIHGGGFTGGSPNDAIFDGTGFAKEGIVVVTVTYRLGAFGFLDWSPMLGPDYADSANNALRDLILALHWVQANIHAFGGDPKRVTIGGESAGAKLTGMLMGIEEAKPLFAQAISESGGAERIRDAADSAAVSKTYAEQFHAIAGAKADPLKAHPEMLLEAQKGLTSAWPANFPLRAQSGGALLPHRAIEPIRKGSSKGKRLLIGTNRDESALFLGNHAAAPLTQHNLGNLKYDRFAPVFEQYRKLYPHMTPAQLNIRALTAEEYWMPSIRLAEAHLAGGGSAHFYRLDEEAAAGPYKGEAYHSFDLGFVWQHLTKTEPDSAQTLSQQMHAAWAAFIKTGTPAASGLPAWPKWHAKTRPTLILKDTSEIQQQPAEAELQLWNGFAFD